MSWDILGSCGAVLQPLRAQQRSETAQKTPRRTPRTPKKAPREPQRLPEARVKLPWGSLKALLGLSWTVSRLRNPQFYRGKTKGRENDWFCMENNMYRSKSKNPWVPLQKCAPLSHESSKMPWGSRFFHFYDILDVAKTEPVPSQTSVLLRQNEGLWKIIKIWLKMALRNHKKRLRKHTPKNVWFFLFFSSPDPPKIELPCGSGDDFWKRP